MAATKQDISYWFDRGVSEGMSHLIVVCDTYDWEDYPVYILDSAETKKQFIHYNGLNMQKVMEVYDLKADKEEQLNETRTFRLPKE